MIYFSTLFSITDTLLIIVPVLLTVAYVTVAERKTMANMQRRLGPNAVGWLGLLQAFADALKLLLKEYVSPTQANLILFFLGPIITLIFSLLGYAVIPYGPGLTVGDLNLDVLYILAMSSLSTYGILLAGFYFSKKSPPLFLKFGLILGKFQEKLKNISQLEAKHLYNVRSTTSGLLINRLIFRLYGIKSILVRYSTTIAQSFIGYSNNKKIILYLLELVLYLSMAWLYMNIAIISLYFFYLFFLFFDLKPFYSFHYTCREDTKGKVLFNKLSFQASKRKDCLLVWSIEARIRLVLGDRKQLFSTSSYYREKKGKIPQLLDYFHLPFISLLYRDRYAPVKPFDGPIIATCFSCLDKDKKYDFLKQWGSKSCIYIIQYKHNPLIYYIGRTTLLKRRFNNHLKGNTGTKLHVFLGLVGFKHFNFSIIEICAPEEQGARENYYLQKYLPLLNTTFSSSFSESAIYESLTSKLTTLKLNLATNEVRTSQAKITKGKAIPVYVYIIYEKYIDENYIKYDSITKASCNEKLATNTLSMFIDTNVEFRNKLYYSNVITNLDLVFSIVKALSSKLNIDSNKAKQVWAYDSKNVYPLKGSPYPSKTQASDYIGISRNVISYFIDSWKAEGIKGTYLFSRPLIELEINKLKGLSERVKFGNKQVVFAYDAKTLELINNSPFPSIQSAAECFKVNSRTISRHLNTKLATRQNKKNIYFFSQKISSDFSLELIKNPAKARYIRQEFWIYKVGKNNILTLIPNQPFKTKREALKVLGVQVSIFNKYLDSKIIYKDLFIFSYKAVPFGVYIINS